MDQWIRIIAKSLLGLEWEFSAPMSEDSHVSTCLSNAHKIETKIKIRLNGITRLLIYSKNSWFKI